MKKLLSIIEYLLILTGLFFIALWINQSIHIKGLYMDDLFNWAWFPGLNLYEYAFKTYGASRYRPFFDMLQYLEYTFVGNRVYLFVYINIALNSLLALFVCHFAKKLNAKRIIAILIAILFIISHFEYYQIGQVLGLIETEAQFFALFTLYLCLKLVGTIELKRNYKININILLVIGILLMYFVIAFTHERYLCLAPVIVLSILFSKNRKFEIKTTKFKIISIIAFALEIIIICMIRQYAIGKMLPAGTGGTYVEETFNIAECLRFCLNQVAFIFGVNIGPEYLVGIDFASLSSGFKLLILASAIFIITLVIIYLIKKINSEKITGRKPNFVTDLLFIVFIAMCIGASSVTVRVEMRFVFVSFTASFLYLAYMCGYMFKLMAISQKKIPNFISWVAIYVLVGLIFITRVPVELKYRVYYPKIHFFVDLARVNSLYDLTIGKYGVDEVLHKRKVYIVNKSYGFTDFYAKWFFKIYDKDLVGNEIILLNDYSEIPKDANSSNSIVLIEDPNTATNYIELPLP